MRRKTIATIVLFCLLASSGGRGDDKAQDNTLRIHLPREIAIDGNVPSVGQIGIIHGDESLAAKAGKIVLGQIAAPGQQVTIDRHVLLSRLACNGIPASQVRLTGAEKVKIRWKARTIKADVIVALARSFLSKRLAAGSIRQADLIREPKDVVLGHVGGEVKLVPSLVKSSTPTQARFRIGVVAGGKEIDSREVVFRLKFDCHKVTTLVDIPSGSVITRENVKVEKTVSNYPEPANWSAPFGLVARRRLPAGVVVSAGMVGPAKPVILVKRNQNVVIRIQAGGLVVTAMGRTIEEGAAGEYVRVRNVNSQRIILAKVNKDGTVEPVL